MPLSSLFKFSKPAEAAPTGSVTVEQLLAYRVDRSRRGWQKQAMVCRDSCARLIELDPENSAVHGLAAAYDIAALLESWKVPWPLICDHMDRFFGLAAKNNESTVCDVVKLIDHYLVAYFDSAEESTQFEVADGAWKYSARDYWTLMAKLKGPQMHALRAAEYFVRGVEQLEVCRPYLDECRNDLLWMICIFCRPCDAKATRFHLPLKDRAFAIELYDEMMEKGVDQLPVGRYARQKAREEELAATRNLRGKVKEDDLIPLCKGIWREEIEGDGQNVFGLRDR